MTIVIDTPLACPPSAAWARERDIALVDALSRPWLHLRFAGGAPLAGRWTAGRSVVVESRLFGLLPLARQEIDVVVADDRTRCIETVERGDLVRALHHRVEIAAAPSGALCRERIDIDAGRLAFLAAPLARFLYRRRAARRQALARDWR